MGIPSLDNVNDKDLRLRIRGHLDEIDEYNQKYIGNEQGYPMSRESYTWTLSATAVCTKDREVVDKVAEYIKDQFQRRDRPSSRKVRRNARRIVEGNGYDPHEFIDV